MNSTKIDSLRIVGTIKLKVTDPLKQAIKRAVPIIVECGKGVRYSGTPVAVTAEWLTLDQATIHGIRHKAIVPEVIVSIRSIKHIHDGEGIFVTRPAEDGTEVYVPTFGGAI
jgi:hypothetical protein